MNNKPHISLISEGSTEISVFIKKTTVKGPGKKGNYPFYNPSMELNRDLSVVFNQWYIDNSKKTLNLLDGLAASGIRGIRFANELEGNTIIHINDWSNDAYKLTQTDGTQFGSHNEQHTSQGEKKCKYVHISPPLLEEENADQRGKERIGMEQSHCVRQGRGFHRGEE